MYRDDVCATCGESLPPDHFYCREHGTEVDDRLHEIGGLLPRVVTDLRRLQALLSEVAQETWDYLADGQPGDPVWPPVPEIGLRTHPDSVAVDIDTEPGLVLVRVSAEPNDLLAVVADGLDTEPWRRFAAACADAAGANATH